MIHFLSTGRHTYTMQVFLENWAAELRQSLSICTYERIELHRIFPPGTYLFTDFERMVDSELQLMRNIADGLAAHKDTYRVLNHPGQWSNRLKFQQKLAALGTQRFRVFPAENPPEDIRFPVFLRRSDDHKGNKTPLLRDRDELERGLAQISKWERAIHPGRWIICEFCDTADSGGMYRKYGVQKIGGRLLPRHLFFNRDWMVRDTNMYEPEYIQEEMDFIENFASSDVAPKLHQFFELCGLDYGRIDYSVLDGEIQVWEINSNPMLSLPLAEVKTPRHPAFQKSMQLTREAFLHLAESSPKEALGKGWKLPVTSYPTGRAIQIYGRWRNRGQR